jgi:luciferase family oxidoreductase group 1
MTVPFSVLDLAPIVAGSDAAQALRNSLDLARHAERLGYHRLWVAEHHGMPGVASAATAVVVGHLAAGTSRIRVGAGGVMLPNHAPLVVAEQFGTLESLFPGRIDLGLGRAPGTDLVTGSALRRRLATSVDEFPQDVLELMAYFDGPAPGDAVVAVPGAGLDVPIWILGSSLYGAQLAAALGLPYAFASHFAPDQLDAALEAYRARFRPSARLQRPRTMAALNVIAAETDEEARLLLTSLQQVFVSLRRGQPTHLQPPRAGFEATLLPSDRAMLEQTLACSVVGSPETVRRGLAAFLERTRADELIVTAQIFDHAARVRSLELTAAARDALGATRESRAAR